MDKTFSVAQLLMLESGDTFVRQAAIASVEELADFAEKELHHAIQLAEENPQFLQACSEDEITNILIISLKSKGIDVAPSKVLVLS